MLGLNIGMYLSWQDAGSCIQLSQAGNTILGMEEVDGHRGSSGPNRPSHLFVRKRHFELLVYHISVCGLSPRLRSC